MKERNIDAFNKDSLNGGYLYTISDKISARMSWERTTAGINKLVDLEGKTVIDVGCGDGACTLDLLRSNPKSITGIDAAVEAIALANQKAAAYENVSFEATDIYQVEAPKIRYDVAIVRGVLHHLYDVQTAIANICLLADEIIVVEPNGYNPILKIIEKTSKYHIEHEEKSYPPYKLDQWFKNNRGRIVESTYIGLVPIFCPDWFAKIAKFFEP